MYTYKKTQQIGSNMVKIYDVKIDVNPPITITDIEAEDEIEAEDVATLIYASDNPNGEYEPNCEIIKITDPIYGILYKK